MIPIYHQTLTRLDWRILWWLLCHQKKNRDGVNTGAVPEGWRGKCKKEMGLIDQQLTQTQKRLRAAGIIINQPYQRDLRINAKAFEYEI